MVLGFSSGPIRMVFMLFYPLMAKVINFLRNGSGPIWILWLVLGFSSGPIRMVFMLFYPLMAKVINFLRNGSGPISDCLYALLPSDGKSNQFSGLCWTSVVFISMAFSFVT